jgi:hypothetical protein
MPTLCLETEESAPEANGDLIIAVDNQQPAERKYPQLQQTIEWTQLNWFVGH